MRVKKCLCLLFLLLVIDGTAQTVLTDSTLSAWLDNDIDFVLFDVRGDAEIDSIVVPCFYTNDAPLWVDSMDCRKRVLVICHGGIYAHTVAEEIVANGYPEDSVFSGAFDELISSRFPAADTMPTALLKLSTEIPRPPTAPELRAILLSRTPYRLIDVRDEWETESGMIPGACVLPWYDNFDDEAVKLPTTDFIFLYCRSGSRASSALDFLIENGFDSSKVINFGGFEQWYEYSLPKAYVPQVECGCPKQTPVARPVRRAPDAVSAQPGNHVMRTGVLLDLRGRGIDARFELPASGLYLRNSRKWSPEMLQVGRGKQSRKAER